MSKDKTLNELIIDEAVNKFKNGEIKNSLDVENFIDSLLEPLMQKLLDAELDNHLNILSMNVMILIIVEMVIVKARK